MDLYIVRYKALKAGNIDPKSPSYDLLVRCSHDPDSLFEAVKPTVLRSGLQLENLFLVSAINVDKSTVESIYRYRTLGSSLKDGQSLPLF